MCKRLEIINYTVLPPLRLPFSTSHNRGLHSSHHQPTEHFITVNRGRSTVQLLFFYLFHFKCDLN